MRVGFPKNNFIFVVVMPAFFYSIYSVHKQKHRSVELRQNFDFKFRIQFQCRRGYICISHSRSSSSIPDPTKGSLRLIVAALS